MNVLVIGQGGREHALVRALKHSPSLASGWRSIDSANLQVHAIPGSAGMARDCVCHDFAWDDFHQVRNVIQRENIELVIVGPEIPLAAGLSDFLRMEGIAVFAPSREAARLESSKIFAKEFMREAGVPTARSFTVSTVDQTESVCGAFAPPYVLKADGLAAGKGVFICKTKNELLAAARSLFEDRVLGDAGATALLEEFSPGFEVS